jgi:hypothetical protein
MASPDDINACTGPDHRVGATDKHGAKQKAQEYNGGYSFYFFHLF